MNLVEHYILEVISKIEITEEWKEHVDSVADPVYEVKMKVDCYGQKFVTTEFWKKSEYEEILKKGYYLA